MFQVELRRSARKDLQDLPSKISEQVERTIDRLVRQLNEGQRPQDMRKLEGRSDTFRIDSGEYRILFSIDETGSLITIFRIRHRRDVYRNL